MVFSAVSQLRRATAALLGAILLHGTALAQVSFTTPDGSTAPLAHCQDYFSYEWNQPLDMSSPKNGPLNDVPKNDVRDLDALSYSNGILSFTSTAGSPTLTLLQGTPLGPNQEPGAVPIGSRYGEKHPIDTSSYHNLTFRLNSTQETVAQVVWGINNLRQAVSNFKILQGWHTYTVDLNSLTPTPLAGTNLAWSAANWQQLVFIPTNSAGVAISVDFIELLSDSGCGSGSLAFSAAGLGSDDRYLVAIDTDTDPSNGVELSVTGASGGSLSRSIGNAASDLPISNLNPGSHYVYGFMSGDWATLTMANPWDFAGTDDLQPSAVFGIGNYSVSGGSFHGTSTSGDPALYLNMRGKKIDASVFNVVSVGVTYAFPPGVTGNSIDMFFFNNGAYVGTKRISNATTPGSHTYSTTLGPADGWSGLIDSIRIDPVNDNASIGTTFSVDFVAIRNRGNVNSLSFPAVQAAPGLLRINNPSLQFLQPDKRGGRDFAQTVLGNSWNMNSTSDIATLYNSTSGQIFPNNAITDGTGKLNIGDFFRSDNVTGNDDPQCPVLNEAPADHRINTIDFMNICFAGWNKTDAAGFNSVARVIWHDASIADARTAFKDGDDIILNQASAEYCLDLSQALDSRTEPVQPNGAPNPWTNVSATGSMVDVLRVDMNEEVEPSFYSMLDYVHLRTDHESNSQYAITINAPLSQQVNLYYKPAGGGAEVAIGTMNAGRNTNIFKWNTSAIAPGKYKIVGRVTQNGNNFVQQADGRVDINHTRTQDTTPPILLCERPVANYTFDTTYEIAGYALDETRLAAVELFVDNQYVKSIEPDRFHLGARDAYPSYAESNNPGFQQLISANGLSYGAHQILLKATDTAGNETSCTFATIRSPGANPPPFSYPPNNDSPADVPVFVPRNVHPRVSVKLLAKSKINYSITGVEECSNVTLYGGNDSKLSYAVVLVTTAGSSSIGAATLNVPTFAKPKKSKDDGILYFMARCDTGELSPKVTFDTKKTKNKKKLTSEKNMLGFLRSKTKVGG